MHILIADRHPVPRSALVNLLRGRLPDARIAEFDTAEEAMESIRTGPVDLMLCGRSTGAPLGPAWMDDLVAAVRPGRLAILTGRVDPVERENARRAGVWGLLPMTSPADVLAAAIGLVLAGGAYFPEARPAAAGDVGPPGAAPLSPRQLQVLRALERGRTNKEIAAEMGVSVATVKLHVQRILRLLGARNRTEAARRLR